MPFPPNPPWLARHEFDTVWEMHLARHDRNKLALDRSEDEHEREHDKIGTQRLVDRTEHASLHEHERAALSERLHEHALAHAREHEMAQRALDKAEAADTVRFESVNEFRKTLVDQAATFAHADTVEAHLQALTLRMEASERNLNERRDVLAGQLGDRLTAVEAFKNSTQGKSDGSSNIVALIFTSITALAAITGILLHFIH